MTKGLTIYLLNDPAAGPARQAIVQGRRPGELLKVDFTIFTTDARAKENPNCTWKGDGMDIHTTHFKL